MKNTIGRKILTIIFIPFLLILIALSLLVSSTIAQYFFSRTELELKGISDINTAQLEGKINSVRITVLSAARIMEKIDYGLLNARTLADENVKAMFLNETVYNAWLVCEPNAFDGSDAKYTSDYPGAPSGRFMRSYVIEDGELVVAPDMDEATVDDPVESPWYTVARDKRQLYVDASNSNENLYDYGVGGDPVYTLSVVAPVQREGRIIGCVGADVLFDTMTFGIDNAKNAAVAVFYADGRVFYAEDIDFAEDSIWTLGFGEAGRIGQAMQDNTSVFFEDEYCPFIGETAFTYFHPIQSEGMDCPLYLYVALPRSAVLKDLTPVIILVAVVAAAALVVWLILFIYVLRRISKPIRELTLSADAISQGHLETEIAFFTESQGEIGMLSRSLRRMVEEFRVYIFRQDQAQERMTIRSLIHAAASNPDIYKAGAAIAEVLGRHFEQDRVTIVFLRGGRASVMARYDSALDTRIEDFPEDFMHHSTVIGLLSRERRLAFLNSFGMRTHRVSFAGEQTLSCCIVMLGDDDDTYGYIIFENKDSVCTFKAGSESSMLYVSEMLTKMISEKGLAAAGSADDIKPQEPDGSIDLHIREEAGVEEKPPVESGLMAALRGVEGLRADLALEAMGGLEEIYIQAVRLFARTARESAERIDEYAAAADSEAYTIEIHGVKGALNNIGALKLGEMAARLETAAKNGDSEYFDGNLGQFMGGLSALIERLAAITGGAASAKPSGDIRALASALESAREAAQSYDSLGASDALEPLTAFSFGEEADGLLLAAVSAIEVKDCNGALDEMERLSEVLIPLRNRNRS